MSFSACLACAALAGAQDSLRAGFMGVELCAARPLPFHGGVYPSLTYSTRRHVIFAGPAVTYYKPSYPRPIFGGQAGYQFFPNGYRKRFNLFFEGHMIFVHGQVKDKFVNYFYHFYLPVATERTINVTALDNYLGFGFRWNILQRLYLKANYGLSLGFYSDNYTYSYAGQVYSGKGGLFPRQFSLSNRIFKVGAGFDLFKTGR